MQEHYAKNIVVGFARLNGKSVGIVANQPAFLAGVLDINASIKGARFVRFCDCFNIPLITFEDVPGFLPGTQQEYRRHHHARRQAAVRLLRSDGAEDHRHHAQGLRRRVLRHGVEAHSHRRELRLADRRDRGDGTGRRGEHRLQARARKVGEPDADRAAKIEEFRERFANPYVAAERGYLDAVIRPRDTRRKLIQALEMLENKRDKNPPKKHGNIPL